MINNIEKILFNSNPKGFNLDAFEAAYEKCLADGHHDQISKLYHQYKGFHKNGVPYNLPNPSQKSWTKPPMTDEEHAIYNGVHLHSESNPFGLHSHVVGGQMGGAHTHGPHNRFGVHSHREPEDGSIMTVDGSHEHRGVNYPDGEHDHKGENFG